jgi:hypothetical protein
LTQSGERWKINYRRPRGGNYGPGNVDCKLRRAACRDQYDAIFASFFVIGRMFSNYGLDGWIAFFLFATILTNIIGFLFPYNSVTLATGSEQPFQIAQAAALVAFVVIAIMALMKSHPEKRVDA